MEKQLGYPPETLKIIKTGERQMEENTAEVPQYTNQSVPDSNPLCPKAAKWVMKILIILVALAVF